MNIHKATHSYNQKILCKQLVLHLYLIINTNYGVYLYFVYLECKSTSTIEHLTLSNYQID